MQIKLINIGYGNIVSANRLLVIVNPESAPVKRMVAEAREAGKVIDGTLGRRTRSVLVMDTGHVILSALQPETLAHKLYGKTEISERHRHRYEVNNDYREVLTKNGMVLSGLSPDGRIVEMIELKEHPFFVATQAHPEFKSRPNLPHPLFEGFVKAAVAYEAAGSSAV